MKTPARTRNTEQRVGRPAQWLPARGSAGILSAGSSGQIHRLVRILQAKGTESTTATSKACHSTDRDGFESSGDVHQLTALDSVHVPCFLTDSSLP